MRVLLAGNDAGPDILPRKPEPKMIACRSLTTLAGLGERRTCISGRTNCAYLRRMVSGRLPACGCSAEGWWCSPVRRADSGCRAEPARALSQGGRSQPAPSPSTFRRRLSGGPPPSAEDGDAAMKLNKLMVYHGMCSRREANDFIKRGLVLVDGAPAHLGQIVRTTQTVKMLPAARHEQAQKVSIMLHKPRGFVSQDSDAKTAAAQQRLAIRCKGRA